MDYDTIIVGAGHNALVCAGYLAKAGQRVGIFERRDIVGGAVVTEEIVPGFKFDLGGSAHILINHMPIVDDLDLASHGLEYIDIDPLFFAPFPDGSHITIWKDIDRTCESIAAVSQRDSAQYRRFIDDWMPVAEEFVELFKTPPSMGSLANHLGARLLRRPARFPDIVRSAMGGYGPLLERYFESPKVQAVIAWMAAQSGPPPGEGFSGPFAIWHPLYHISGMRRPRGGSGMLTQALGKMIEAKGGEIHLGDGVRQIHCEGGRATEIETESGRRATAARVVSGTHIHTTLGMLDESMVPRRITKKIRSARIGNGFGMVVRFAMNELPQYTALPTDGVGEHHRALQFICPDIDYLNQAFRDFEKGMPSRDPALIAMTFSTVDESLAPPGKHTMFLWGQYYPYELASGEDWDVIGDREADRMLAKLAEYAPNIEGAVIDRLVETPLYLERELGLLQGNVMHLEMSSDQMFFNRPARGASMYNGPIPGLYLTGASTHPGGGIMGAAGRNAAHVILDDS